MKIIFKLLLYIILGVIWSVTNIGYTIGFLALITLFPFLFFIRKEALKSGIFYSLVFGVSFYLFHLDWMPGTVISFFSDYNPTLVLIIGWFVTFLLSLYHGFVYVIIFCILYILRKRTKESWYFILIPVVFCVVDYFYPKLWFDQIGYAAHRIFTLEQMADLFGVPILTAIIIMSNVSLFLILETVLGEKRFKFTIGYTVVFLAVFIASNIYGIVRITEIRKLMAKAPKAKIEIVQENISGLEKRDKAHIDRMIAAYNLSSEKFKDRSPDLIIWPESAVPNYYPVEKEDYSDVNKTGFPLLFGTHIDIKKQKGDDVDSYNSFVLVSKDGKKLSAYYKRKLLPFIEEFPIPQFNFLMHMYGLSNFSRGRENIIMELGKLKMAPNICYEDIIPDYIRQTIKVKGKTANILVNATNNSWFGNSREPYMHLHMGGLRAIENRRVFARATCTGYTSIYSPTGKLSYESGLFEKDITEEGVPLLEIDTVYQKFGWLFPYAMLAILGAGFIIILYKKK